MARTANQQGNLTRRRSGGWVSHSLRRRKHSDRSPINPCLKHTLFLINFFLLAFFVALIVFTTYILVEKNKKVNSLLAFILDPSCLLCVIGCIGLIISFFGCGGGLRENICFLKVYYFILIVALVLEILVVIFIFVIFFVDGALAVVTRSESFFEDAVIEYRSNFDSDVTGTIDSLQEKLSCCGVSNDEEGYKDWNKNIYFACNVNNTMPESCSVPFSCCKLQGGDKVNLKCGSGVLRPGADTSEIHVNGCLKGLQIFVQDNIWIVGGVVIGILLPQIILSAFANTLVSQIEEQMMKW